ncbi:hypothetical protein HYV81_03135 [Candidatus Woesearchaeota archaeon]|nr:hypothetical protein [Candidatus Woesearchaeota archaeon]
MNQGFMSIVKNSIFEMLKNHSMQFIEHSTSPLEIIDFRVCSEMLDISDI